MESYDNCVLMELICWSFQHLKIVLYLLWFVINQKVRKSLLFYLSRAITPTKSHLTTLSKWNFFTAFESDKGWSPWIFCIYYSFIAKRLERGFTTLFFFLQMRQSWLVDGHNWHKFDSNPFNDFKWEEFWRTDNDDDGPQVMINSSNGPLIQVSWKRWGIN